MSEPIETKVADWDQRARRLGRIVAKAELAADFPLVKAVRLPASAVAALEGSVTAYLWHSLIRAFPASGFVLGPGLITDYASDLMALPNRTPNGVVLPRRDTFSSYNVVHQALVGAMEATNLLPCFSLLQVPCNVRVLSGAPDPETEGRSYSSAKMHTDVWNGEPLSSILFNIPVLGDTRAVDLRFYEPRYFPESLRIRLSDYVLGSEVARSVSEYPMSFDLGRAYVSDSISLHKTVKAKSMLRVSLDFRSIPVELLPGETPDHHDSRAVYAKPDVWRAGGTTIVLGSGEPLDAFPRRLHGEVVSRDVLSIMNIDDPAESLFDR